jgi:pimeloyl-ACP methyl ester carboxylesterase
MSPEQIFFLHGLESSSQGTKARFFENHFPQVVSPDFSGNLTERLLQLEKMCLRKTDLIFVGSSFGGLMATCFAIKHPEKVARLILMVPALNFGDYRAPKIKLSIPTLLIAGRHDTITPPALVIPLAQKTFSNLEIRIEEDDHMLHNSFRQLDWSSLLN